MAVKEPCNCEKEKGQKNNDVSCQTDTMDNNELEKPNIACQTEDVDSEPITKSHTEKEIFEELTFGTNHFSLENKTSADKQIFNQLVFYSYL